MKELYDYPEIYDERWSEQAHAGYRSHYEKMFSGCGLSDILDCSIGTGNLTFCLADLGYEIHGSDISASMLERAKDKAAARKIACTFTQCDFRELSRHFTRKFSCVMSSGNALGHVDNEEVRGTIREMDKLVKEGGFLYLDSRNWDRALKNKRRFHNFQLPFQKEDGEKIYYVQVWDYNADGTITINILNAYEQENRIVRQEVWEERLTPFSIDVLLTELQTLGYMEPTIRNIPCVADMEFDDMEWYCLLARKG